MLQHVGPSDAGEHVALAPMCERGKQRQVFAAFAARHPVVDAMLRNTDDEQSRSPHNAWQESEETGRMHPFECPQRRRRQKTLEQEADSHGGP